MLTQACRRSRSVLRTSQAWCIDGRRDDRVRHHAGRGCLSASTTPENASSGPPNWFRLLNVPQTFALDEQQLKDNYRHLMNQYHPDKAATTSSPESSPYDASLITHAYDTLQRPHTRAQHLLALEAGVHVGESDTDTDTLSLDMATLAEIMEIRERIDGTSDPHVLRELWDQNQERIASTGEDLEKAFRERDYEAAMQLTAKMQYWNRIYETLWDKLPE